MITYKETDRSCFPLYDQIPMRLLVTHYYRMEKINRGLGGFLFTETPVEPHVKDFCTGEDSSVSRWEKRWDISNWAFFMAFENEKPVGGAAAASRTKEINMLENRDDLAVLWDIRVHDDFKHMGIGKKLFGMAAGWSRAQGFKQLKIECQNNNVPAIKFYHKQGAILSAINEYAYYNVPHSRHEIQLIWYLDL